MHTPEVQTDPIALAMAKIQANSDPWEADRRERQRRYDADKRIPLRTMVRDTLNPPVTCSADLRSMDTPAHATAMQMHWLAAMRHALIDGNRPFARDCLRRANAHRDRYPDAEFVITSLRGTVDDLFLNAVEEGLREFTHTTADAAADREVA